MMTWLRDFLIPAAAHDTHEKYQAAVIATDALIVASRSLTEQLRPFRESPDPFGAIQRAARLSDEWEQPQEAAIHKGPTR